MKNLKPVAGLREVLEAFHSAAPDFFRRVFLDGQRFKLGSEGRTLVEAGLLDRRGKPRVRLFPFHGHFIATDRLDYRDVDQVFSLGFEQHYLVRNSSLREGDDVLELCSGSGANCLFASDRAKAVTGTDISPRALAFAEFNRAVNTPDRPIEFLRGSLFEPLEQGRTFDLILINPPFEYVPEGEPHFLHSDGGVDGLSVIRTCLEAAPRHLSANGRFEIITYSPGSQERPALFDLLTAAFPGHDVECHILDVDPIENHLRAPETVPTTRRRRPLSQKSVEAWRRRLEEQGLTHNLFLFCRVSPGSGGVTMLRPKEEIAACWRLC
ncbi:MAG: methyltransferase [Planctomycetota bacterium]